jgi:hypothetical protein
MIPLGKDSDTIDFDALLALARARLPAVAKDWTDYNYHDPGIMLIEMIAWVIDSQIYSISRNRTDERLGFLRLLGARARGAKPAKGMVVPAASPPAASNVARGTVLKSAFGGAPRLEADAAITLLPASIKRISIMGQTSVSDVTDINARERAAFSAFGADGQSALKIDLMVDNGQSLFGPALLSLGFRLEAVAPGAETRRYGRVDAYRPDGARLHRTRDTTLGLQRSGVMIFAINAEDLTQPIILRVAQGYALNPKLLNIAPNALPVEQRASFVFDEARGNGGSGQTIEIAPGTLFPADETQEERVWRLLDGAAALQVSSLSRGGRQVWTRGRLDEAEPNGTRFAAEEAIDGSRISLRFGNGVNGLRPGLDEPISVALKLSCGSSGDITQPTDWVMTPSGVRWRNPGPICGGADPQTPDEALSDLRLSLEERRPLAASKQIEEAVHALPEVFAVGRIQVEEKWERGRRAPAISATRTLIVANSNPGNETSNWINAIRRRIAPRIAIGERLLVAPPRYRRMVLHVQIVAASGSQPLSVANDVRDALAARFDPQQHPWPFGRDVSANVLAGWARKVPGVARVTSVEIQPAEGGPPTAQFSVGRGELPLLVGAPIVIAKGAGP